jgi:hypothetical protein
VGNAFNRQEQAAKILEDFLTNDDIIHHGSGDLSTVRKSLVLARQEQYRKGRMEKQPS